ncbi:ACP S-malonyltransferase [Candidatus Rhodoluna planktonica]|uniref:Malonyl CoA-acyl carrier protein transacylase n=1 Tax=Candidatus Rhodoluna planktonica TaxID=535712 RepID=A0A1D9DYU2_9MICO|nr:ACP S-malonyltransferase [Candidatus Rhodoluna planktonica]AOY55984.1 ACP S-malonyltransferase [Candidatus Rhodoluna planktonica]
MIALLCPGQGSQTPGFLAPWLELTSFREAIESMQEVSGIDLIAHGTVSDADTIRDTAIAQPLIVAAGIATMAALMDGKDLHDSKVSGIAGHSVGEITAAVGAGIFDAATGIKFVRERGEAMARAAALESTSMAAILGGELQAIEDRLSELELEPANYNGPGQIVAAGATAQIGELQANPPAGTRVVPLQVAGAFHSRFMKPAQSSLAQYANSMAVADPTIAIWSNQDGHQVSSGDEFLKRLVSQVASPVRWDLCMQNMIDSGVTSVIELAPAGTLAGIAKRAMPGVEIVAVKTPENLDAALSILYN